MVAGLVGRQLANMGRAVSDEQESESEDEISEEALEVVVPPEVVVIQNPGKVAPITWDF